MGQGMTQKTWVDGDQRTHLALLLAERSLQPLAKQGTDVLHRALAAHQARQCHEVSGGDLPKEVRARAAREHSE